MAFTINSIEIYSECKFRKVVKPGKYTFVSRVEDTNGFFGKNIMVSAIVGKNGSGKSSLLELIFRMINNLSAFMVIGNRRPSAAKMFYVKGIRADLSYEIDGMCGILKSRDMSMGLEYNDEKVCFGKPCEEFTDYEDCSKTNNDRKIELMKQFFYSIVTNYSLQAYTAEDYKNEKVCEITKEGKLTEKTETGIWINSLFHKNDGYLTAMNLNPFRNNGKIDMVIEARLARQRMAALLLYSREKKQQLIEGYSYGKIEYQLDISTFKDKFNQTYEEWIGNRLVKKAEMTVEEFLEEFRKQLRSEETIATRILQQFPIGKIDPDSDLKLYGYLYIVYKVLSIASKYPSYREFDDIGDTSLCIKKVKKEERVRAILLAKRVNTDHSHITTKVTQAINYILKLNNSPDCSFMQDSETPFSYERYENLNTAKGEKKRATTIEFLMSQTPPPFFLPHIYLKPNNSDPSETEPSKGVLMESLSSGERQFYFAVSTLIYHIFNIKSVPISRIHYRNILLVLDEIELCFHPEYQRTFIKRLIDLLERLHLNTFLSFHIITTTHSPFILSDVPSDNILYLKQGIEQNNNDFINPFGANLNDILYQSFFLENGFMGAFAQEKIKSLINFLSSEKMETKEWDKFKAEKLIKCIGEPILKVQLEVLFDRKFIIEIERQKLIDDLQARIDELKREI
ncbi:ATP-binding protein [Bacteroides fragilis]|uniref:AAA family ATPase n=1 Tax=Bacteroides hominis TaxID=2763023 RepID=UPI00294059A9|nr:ATP-binding protein [Bacteroides fragilis]MCX8465182.1 AAA family ATPase [Bacteroides fragilis]UHZ89124.1 ATP-binding protein [Bacteroides fragilis]